MKSSCGLRRLRLKNLLTFSNCTKNVVFFLSYFQRILLFRNCGKLSQLLSDRKKKKTYRFEIGK